MRGRAVTSSINYQWTYDVFINFRGEDIRYGFIGHLNKALNEKGVRTFFDDNEIGIGDEISPTLFKAINESRMAITVFSKNYASSTFCLNELVQIHQCIKGNGRLVWPIFYDVDPSEVRHQKAKYGEALVLHKQKSRADDDKISSWKHALREVANLKGSSYDPRTRKGVYEHELIEEVVNHIFRLIKRVPLYVAEYPVGLYSRVKKIRSLLQLGSNDKVMMMGICGTGGIGKTTIACAVYNAIADHFDYLCFLDDIKGESEKHGLKQEQAKMLSKILGQKEEIEDINQGIVFIKRILKGKKVLLILDNVDKQEQLKKLAGACDWFGSGSRIIITTRDLQLLKRHEIERIYEMKGLNHEESLELLSWNGFRKMQVDDLRYKDVVERVISYAGGLPLALELIGSDLYGKNVKEWESKLDGCKKIPHDDIQQKLRVSYDGLEQHEKQVFLDISCFYKGKDLEYVKKMVRSAHDLDPDYQIGVLADKCLIRIEKDSWGGPECIKMHDLIQDMGREIVRLESPNDPGKRSRLWSSTDICLVLESRKRTYDEVIIIIQVETLKFMEVYWDGKAFESMNNLRILILENTKFSKGPKYLPNSLAILRWRGYPSSSLPHGFRPKDLVEFDVRESRFKSMPRVSKAMPNVTVLNFAGCENIRHIPNLSGLSSLRKLWLPDCKNLIGIDNSVGQLPKLKTLSVSNCTQLMTFPSQLNTPSLVHLDIDGCSSLKYFPEIETRDMKISRLSLFGTGIKQLPPSIENLTKLKKLFIRPAKGRSMKLPSRICLLEEFEYIDIEGCEGELLMEPGSIICPKIGNLSLRGCNISNENLRIFLTSFSNVIRLDLTDNNFTILPACIENCQNLVELGLDGCKHLIEVEKVPPSIQRLRAANCTSLSSKSKKLLRSKDLLASVIPNNDKLAYMYQKYTYRKAGVCISVRSIPKWFDHCSKRSSVSFWFRGYSFPSLCVYAIFNDTWLNMLCNTEVFINDELAYDENMETMFGSVRYTEYHHHHILVYYIWDYNIRESFEEDQWNHAKICHFPNAKVSGIYVIRDEWTNMENVRFTDPFQSSDFLRGDQGMVSSPLRCLDIDSLRRLSAACRRLEFPIKIHMNRELCINKEDVMEFLSMQELCITIIQLFLMFCKELCIFRGIDHRFGFLCPNAVQGMGRTRKDRISYIESTIKESTKQCWLAPIHEGNLWTLCAICPELNIIYWFDSLGGKQSYDIEKVFTEALKTYPNIGEKNTKWLYPNCHRQVEDKECGYYIMQYMYDIIEMNEVHSFDTHFNNPQCYSQEDIINIQNKCSAYLLHFHTRDIWSVNPFLNHYRSHVVRRLFGLTSISLCNGKDEVCWEGDIIGKYSVNQGYPLSLQNAFIIWKTWRESQLDHNLNYYLWKIELPHNQLLFIWKLVHSLVPIGEGLRKDHSDVQVYCAFGCQAAETVGHLFCSCPYIKAIWFGALSIRFDKLPYQGFLTWLRTKLTTLFRNGDMAMLKGIIILLNLIWTKWSMTLHTGLICNPEEVIRDFQGSFQYLTKICSGQRFFCNYHTLNPAPTSISASCNAHIIRRDKLYWTIEFKKIKNGRQTTCIGSIFLGHDEIQTFKWVKLHFPNSGPFYISCLRLMLRWIIGAADTLRGSLTHVNVISFKKNMFYGFLANSDSSNPLVRDVISLLKRFSTRSFDRTDVFLFPHPLPLRSQP